MGLNKIVAELKKERSSQTAPVAWLFRQIQETKEVPPPKHTDWMRASSIPYLCPREEVLCGIEGVTRIRAQDGCLRATMDLGEILHHQYRDWYYGPRGKYLGAWLCLVCGKTTHEEVRTEEGIVYYSPIKPPGIKLLKMPESCPHCSAPRAIPVGRPADGPKVRLIIYHELEFRNKKYRIYSHPDGWRVDLVDEIRIILQELKSASPNWYRKMGNTGPTKEAITQLMIGMWLSGTKEGEVVYMNKSGWKKPSEYYQYHRYKLSRKRIDRDVIEPVLATREGLKTGKVPVGICRSIEEERAKGCKVADLCFGGKKRGGSKRRKKNQAA